MLSTQLKKIYNQHIKSVSTDRKLELIALIRKDLTTDPTESKAKKRRSLLELEGRGAELWDDVDPLEYIDKLRDEWERPRNQPPRRTK